LVGTVCFVVSRIVLSPIAALESERETRARASIHYSNTEVRVKVRESERGRRVRESVRALQGESPRDTSGENYSINPSVEPTMMKIEVEMDCDR